MKLPYYSFLRLKRWLVGKDITMKNITIHCTFTPEGRHITVEQIDRWHKKRGWSGIGYHWAIYLDGSVHQGRPENKIGAHVKGFNIDNLGIVYVGGCDINMNPKDTRTPEQKLALIKLLKEKRLEYPFAKIKGHRDFPNVKKVCPCFDAEIEYRYI